MALEHQKNNVEHTLRVLNKLLGKCQDRLDGYAKELEDMESLMDLGELTRDEHTKNKFFALSVNIAKDEHMKFYLCEEIDRLDNIHSELLIAISEECD